MLYDTVILDKAVSSTPYGKNKMNPSNVSPIKVVNMKDFDSQDILITPTLAQVWLKVKNFSRQRPLNDNHINSLSRTMIEGRFKGGSQIAICTLPDGSEQITNGYHRLHAIIRSGVSLYFQIRRRRVVTQEEIDEDYASHDEVSISRGAHEGLRAMQIATPGTYYTAAVRAIARLDTGSDMSGRATRFFSHDISHQATLYLPIEEKRKELFSRRTETSRLCQRAGVLAVILITILHQEDEALKFWHLVADDYGESPAEPARALIRWLRTQESSGGAKIWLHMRATAHAWNKFYEGEKLSVLRIPNDFSIYGTPYRVPRTASGGDK